MSSKQGSTAVGELHIGAALVPPEPALRDGSGDPAAEVVAAATCRQKGRIYALHINPTVLHRFYAVRDFDQLACSYVGIGEGARRDESHAAILSSLSAPRI